MDTWAVISQKGGAGKTTLALHLAIAAMQAGKLAGVIDVDPQESAIKWARIRDEHSPPVTKAVTPELGEMRQTAEDAGADVLIIDTSPRANAECIAIAKIADLIIVPSRPSVLDLQSIADTIELLEQAGAKGRTVVVLNAVAARTTEGKDAAAVLNGLDVTLAPTRIGERADYRHALTAGKGVTELDPKSQAAKEINTLYKWLAKHASTLADSRKKAHVLA